MHSGNFPRMLYGNSEFRRNGFMTCQRCREPNYGPTESGDKNSTTMLSKRKNRNEKQACGMLDGNGNLGLMGIGKFTVNTLNLTSF